MCHDCACWWPGTIVEKFQLPVPYQGQEIIESASILLSFLKTDCHINAQLNVAQWHHMVTYIWVNIGSGNGLLPWWHQAITWTNVELLSKVFCSSKDKFTRCAYELNSALLKFLPQLSGANELISDYHMTDLDMLLRMPASIVLFICANPHYGIMQGSYLCQLLGITGHLAQPADHYLSWAGIRCCTAMRDVKYNLTLKQLGHFLFKCNVSLLNCVL